MTASGAARAAGDPSIAGDWAVTSEVTVRIAPCPGAQERFCGVLIAWPRTDDGRAALDAQNPDARLAQRPLIGVRTINGLKETAPGQWSGATYNPEDGRTYDLTLTPQPSGVLNAQFCLMKRCETLTWKPAD